MGNKLKLTKCKITLNGNFLLTISLQDGNSLASVVRRLRNEANRSRHESVVLTWRRKTV